jgi:hypothetical protein
MDIPKLDIRAKSHFQTQGPIIFNSTGIDQLVAVNMKIANSISTVFSKLFKLVKQIDNLISKV